MLSLASTSSRIPQPSFRTEVSLPLRNLQLWRDLQTSSRRPLPSRAPSRFFDLSQYRYLCPNLSQETSVPLTMACSLVVGIFVAVAISKSMATVAHVVFLSKFSSLCYLVISNISTTPKYALIATKNSSDHVSSLFVTSQCGGHLTGIFGIAAGSCSQSRRPVGVFSHLPWAHPSSCADSHSWGFHPSFHLFSCIDTAALLAPVSLLLLLQHLHQTLPLVRCRDCGPSIQVCGQQPSAHSGSRISSAHTRSWSVVVVRSSLLPPSLARRLPCCPPSLPYWEFLFHVWPTKIS